MPFSALANVAVSLIGQCLPGIDLIRLSRCCRHTRHALDNAVSWRNGASLTLTLHGRFSSLSQRLKGWFKSAAHPPALSAALQQRCKDVRLKWIPWPGSDHRSRIHGDDLDLLLRTIASLTLSGFDASECACVTARQLVRAVNAPSMQGLTELHIHSNKAVGDVSRELVQGISQLRGLKRLSLFPLQPSPPIVGPLADAPALESLHLRDSFYILDESLMRIVHAPLLRELHLWLPHLDHEHFLPAFTCPLARQLVQLTLDTAWEPLSQPTYSQPKPASADISAAMTMLVSLRAITLIKVFSIQLLWPHLKRAPALARIVVQPGYNDLTRDLDRSAPSVDEIIASLPAMRGVSVSVLLTNADSTSSHLLAERKALALYELAWKRHPLSGVLDRNSVVLISMHGIEMI